MPNDNRGALGSNQPLERVPVDEEPLAEKEKDGKIIADVPVATSSTTEDDGDVVYLREDLRPVRRR